MSRLLRNDLAEEIARKTERGKKVLKKIFLKEEKTAQEKVEEMLEHHDELDQKLIVEEVRSNLSLIKKRTREGFEPDETHSALFIYIVASRKSWEIYNRVEKLSTSLGTKENRDRMRVLSFKVETLLEISEFLKDRYSLDSFSGRALEDLSLVFEDLDTEIELLRRDYRSTREENIYEESEDLFRNELQAMERIEERNREMEKKMEDFRNQSSIIGSYNDEP